MSSDNSENNEEQTKDPLYAKLAEDVDESDWSLLQPHHERKAVFIIADEVDLIEVGVAMAKDDVDKVRTWMADQKLSQPDEEKVEAWGSDLQQRFKFLIIQPYVLVKPLREEQ